MSGLTYTGRSVPTGVSNLGGGLNSTASGLAVQDNESTSLQNIDFDIFGSIKKRNGYTRLNTSAFNSGATFVGLHWYEKSDGTQKLFGIAGNKIARMSDLDGTWSDITGAVTITAGNNNHVSSTTFLDTALFTNGVDVPFQATDSGNASASTVPTNLTKAKWVTNWNNYAFYANVTVAGTAHPSRIYWSNIKSISTWTATDFVDINQNDGQQIMGIKPLGDRLIIFKERSIHAASFTGDSDIPFLFFQTPSSVGCVSGHSIQEVSNGLVFVSKDGLYFFDGANSFKVSDRIQATLDTFAKNRFQNATSTFQREKNRYLCSFTTSAGSTHNRVITWDANNNAFSLYLGSDGQTSATAYAANVWVSLTTSGQERIYFGDYAGFVYRADTTSNDNPSGTSTAIRSTYKTKWFNFQDLINKKGVTEIAVYYRLAASTLSLGYSYDFEDADQFSQSFSLNTSTSVYGTAVYGTDTYASSGGAVIRRSLTSRGRVFRLSFSNNTASETFQIDGLGFFPHLETSV